MKQGLKLPGSEEPLQKEAEECTDVCASATRTEASIENEKYNNAIFPSS